MADTNITPSVGAIAAAGVAAALILTATPEVSVEEQGRSGLVTWPTMATLYVGAAGPRFRYSGASFQATGTFGGGSCKLQGSNSASNGDWFDLSPAALTGAGFFAALGAQERPKYIRPSCTGGDATTSISVVGWYS
jgi:hypothetical protein